MYNYTNITIMQGYGVKGPSWLITIPSFELIDGMSIDYMHCVLLGVTRMFLQLWFNLSYHSELWYIGSTVHEVGSRLREILPPYKIQLTPRSIEKHVKYWEGKLSLCDKAWQPVLDGF